MLTAAEQIVRERAEGALSRLEKAKLSGDKVAIAQARLACERLQAELQMCGAGALSAMRSALSRSLTSKTVL